MFPPALPIPRQWFRKHVFQDGGYETLLIIYVPERESEGILHPKILKCQMFGTLGPQEEFDAPDIGTAKVFADGHFSRRFPAHLCNEGCIDWPELNDYDVPDEPTTGQVH